MAGRARRSSTGRSAGGEVRRRVWLPAVPAAGLPAIHLHDLRHGGNTFTANAGANLRELMQRMGHSSTRAALIYLHGGDQRQRTIGDSVSDMAQQALHEQPGYQAESD
jgi:integrase